MNHNLIMFGVPIVVLLLITLWLLTLRRIVPTNVVHILQRGKQTVSYGVGKGDNVYYHFPSWLPFIGVSVREMPVSNFDIDLHEYPAYDKERLPFLVDVKAFFHIADTNKAAEKVESFTQLKEQLENVVKGAVRSILAQNTLDDIMEKRGIFGEQFTSNVNTDLKNWGVESIKNIELMDIRDSSKSNVIQQIMAKKISAIDAESRKAIAENKMIAENAELDSKQQIATRAAETDQKIGESRAQSDQAVSIAKSESAKKSGIAMQQADAEVAEAEKATTVKKLEVERTKQVQMANIAKETAIIEAKQAAEQMEITAEANKKQLEVQAEARRVAAEKDAAAMLVKQENEAKGNAAVGKAAADVILAKGNAEAEAKKHMELARVTAETTLAEKIGKDEGYQKYLVRLAEVKVNEVIGVAQANSIGLAMQKAEVKLMVNTGDVHSGIGKLSDLFTSKGGSQLNGLMEALAQSDNGVAIIDFISNLGKKKE